MLYRGGRDADFSRIVNGDLKYQASSGSVRVQVVLNRLNPLGVLGVAVRRELVRGIRRIGDVLGGLQEDHRIGRRPAASQGIEFIHAAGGQFVRAGFKVIAPHGLIENVPIVYLGAEHNYDDPGKKKQAVPANAKATEDTFRRAEAYFAKHLKQ